MKNVAILLNRVFRLEQNPLLQSVTENIDAYNNIYIVLLEEDLTDASSIKRDFYIGTLHRFIKELQQNGVMPYVMPYDAFKSFCQNKQITNVVMAPDIMSYHRPEYDAPTLNLELGKHNIEVHFIKTNHYLTPSQTLKADGSPYRVFTPFYRKNRQLLKHKIIPKYNIKDLADKISSSSEDYELGKLDTGSDARLAQHHWQEFLDFYVEDYNVNREYLSEIRTSQLSIALAYGLLDIRQIMNDLLVRYNDNETEYEGFIRELMFREFYYVLMTQFPESATTSFKEKYRDMTWSDNEDHFRRWKAGQTGYPIIDAAMNELKETGFMHNRTRMVVSQFLTKDLFIDWRLGEDYFRKALIDYDNASNVHGWQWSASTGSDAVPYFRVFNPVRQSERFLGDGAYVRQYLPVLKHVPVKYLHAPIKYEDILKNNYNITLGKDYPYFIVDHKTQRDHMVNQFEKF